MSKIMSQKMVFFQDIYKFSKKNLLMETFCGRLVN